MGYITIQAYSAVNINTVYAHQYTVLKNMNHEKEKLDLVVNALEKEGINLKNYEEKKDGLGDVSCVLKTGLVVPGGGATEIELTKSLKDFGHSLSGRERIAVEDFASAREFLQITLAETPVLDPIDIKTKLKAIHISGDGLSKYFIM